MRGPPIFFAPAYRRTPKKSVPPRPASGVNAGPRAQRRAAFPINVPDMLIVLHPNRTSFEWKDDHNNMEVIMANSNATIALAYAAAKARLEAKGTPDAEGLARLTERAFEETSDAFETALDHDGLAMLSVVDGPEAIDMPDADMARSAVELVISTLFDVFRDTRLEPFSRDLAWGFVNSFDVVSRRIERREDDAAKELRDLARIQDPSEVFNAQLEDQQLLTQTLQSQREAFECMRDHAAQCYHMETGLAWTPTRGSRTSQSNTASQVDAMDFLKARDAKRAQERCIEGDMVIFSGGSAWFDHQLLWDRLDNVLARYPNMALATTAQTKGCDAIAAAWAQARKVKLVMFRPNFTVNGKRAGYVRNELMLNSVKAVEAIVCEGSSVQGHLATELRNKRIPTKIFRLSDQREAATRSAG